MYFTSLESDNLDDDDDKDNTEDKLSTIEWITFLGGPLLCCIIIVLCRVRRSYFRKKPQIDEEVSLLPIDS